ncbi:MAG: flavin reductase family protein [Alphaproteobacteria bacterium]
MKVDSHTFRNAMASFACGVTVVTARTTDGRPLGLTVSSFASVSLEPPLVLVCLDRNTSNLDSYCEGHFAVNVLREDQKDLSIRFATRRGDKWTDTAFTTWDSGVPILSGCLATLECGVEHAYDGGDHVIIVGRVQRLTASAAGQPLLYFRSAYAEIGRAV